MRKVEKLDIPEALVYIQWLKKRFIDKNQNALIAVTGPTGSGKSYACHRLNELWYRYFFKEEYDVHKFTSFSIEEVMRKLTSKEIREGDMLIFEEAGTQLGSLDFQNKVNKLFTYVLQSFRSMNVGILFNLPYLSMLNKSARMLLHGHFSTAGINKSSKKCFLRPKFIQINQTTGKDYNKYLRANIRGRRVKVQKMGLRLPSLEIRNAYEQKKKMFVDKLNQGVLDHIHQGERKRRGKMTERQEEVYTLDRDGYNSNQIAEKLKISARTVQVHKKSIQNNGFLLSKDIK